MSVAASPQPSGPRRTSAVDSSASWRPIDRVMLGFCWAAGIALCLIAFGIVAYMAVRGALRAG